MMRREDTGWSFLREHGFDGDTVNQAVQEVVKAGLLVD
jgi:hypothetical protein